MTDQHLSEEELQIVAMNEQIADADMTLHILGCALCQEQVAVYRSLLIDIHEQPAPVFDFDLETIVLQQLPAAKAKTGRSIRPFLIIAFVIVCLYFFRTNFLHLVTGTTPWYLLTAIVSGITIIALKAMNMYHKYQQQVEKLNLFK